MIKQFKQPRKIIKKGKKSQNCIIQLKTSFKFVNPLHSPHAYYRWKVDRNCFINWDRSIPHLVLKITVEKHKANLTSSFSWMWLFLARFSNSFPEHVLMLMLQNCFSWVEDALLMLLNFIIILLYHWSI